MRVLKIIGWGLLGWILASIVVGISFSLLLALAGESNLQLENAVGGLGGLAGLIGGLVYGTRRHRRRQVGQQ